MRGEDMWTNLIYAGVAVYILWLWLQDKKLNGAGQGHPRAFPGAYGTSAWVIAVCVVGALAMLGIEVWGEYALGIVAEQETLAASFLLSMLAAAIIEEVIFRGYLVVDRRGVGVLVASIVGFSLLFTLLHPYLWHFEMPEEGWAFWQGQWEWDFSPKAMFTAGMTFLTSLWFYACRFMPLNKAHSLLPCFYAHGAYNLGVFGVKWAQGFIAF